jgi:hypothetical protein
MVWGQVFFQKVCVLDGKPSSPRTSLSFLLASRKKSSSNQDFFPMVVVLGADSGSLEIGQCLSRKMIPGTADYRGGQAGEAEVLVEDRKEQSSKILASAAGDRERTLNAGGRDHAAPRRIRASSESSHTGVWHLEDIEDKENKAGAQQLDVQPTEGMSRVGRD